MSDLRSPSGRAAGLRPQPAAQSSQGSIPSAELPPFLLAQLSSLPEEKPDDFECAICRQLATNKWNHSPRDFERPPICKSCETITGHRWNGGAYYRTKPTGGTHRDKREALRIGALADAISGEANSQQWRAQYGRP